VRYYHFWHNLCSQACSNCVSYNTNYLWQVYTHTWGAMKVQAHMITSINNRDSTCLLWPFVWSFLLNAHYLVLEFAFVKCTYIHAHTLTWITSTIRKAPCFFVNLIFTTWALCAVFKVRLSWSSAISRYISFLSSFPSIL